MGANLTRTVLELQVDRSLAAAADHDGPTVMYSVSDSEVTCLDEVTVASFPESERTESDRPARRRRAAPSAAPGRVPAGRAQLPGRVASGPGRGMT